jgi:ribA/ribD-fused uncharacterized protein
MNDNNVINFYLANGEYGCFSNFSRHRVFLKDRVWKTSEHYFQAQKFAGTEFEEKVRLAPTPKEAAELGRNRKFPLRKDWETVKDDVMRDALRAKFTQHEDLRRILLGTKDATLVEHTANDNYWADGGDGSGQNMLGRLLMELREELKKDDSET